ncbi:MAG TPA: hypothetical protein VGG34_07300 [Opitutaceae bacterium]|jgi:hypothetical protein
MVVTGGRAGSPLVLVSVAALLALYALFLSLNVEAVAGGADSSGYLNHARVLAGWHVRVATRRISALPADRVPDYLYAPLGFRPVDDRPEQVVPIYPPGFPLLVILARLLVGWGYAAKAVLVLHAVAGVVLAYLLGRGFGLQKGWAAAGAVVLAASPLYLLISLQPLSDLPALVWTSAAVFCGLNAPKKDGWAIASGLAFGISVLIRPNCIITILGLAVLMGTSWRRWLSFALGGLPSAAFFLLYSYAVYGNPLATGYGNAAGMFRAEAVPGTLVYFAHWLPLVFTPAICVFPLLVLPGMAPARSAWGLAVCVGTYLAFYAAYVVQGRWTWPDLRFLLPISPALIVGSLLVWQAIGARAGRGMAGLRRRAPLAGAWAAGLALLLAGAVQFQQDKKLHVLALVRGEPTYELACRWINQNLPPNCALACMQFSGAAYYYTSMVVLRYDELNPSNYRAVFAAADAEGRPVYAVLFNWEEKEALSQRMPCGWLKVREIRDATIWRRTGGAGRLED